MNKIHYWALFLVLATLGACKTQERGEMTVKTEGGENPLLTAFETPFGVPPFDKIKDEHFLPAFEEGMKQHKAEVKAIIENPAEPTFANTMEALERSGALLGQVAQVFFIVNASHTNDAKKDIANTIAPKLSVHEDDISLNSDLFKRIDAIYQKRASLNLRPDQLRLLTEKHKEFVRAGVNLAADDKIRMRAINEELSSLSQKFGQNLLDETNDFQLVVENEADLGDLPQSLKAAAQTGDGMWTFTLHRPSINPFLQYSPNREMRKQLFEGYANRANRDNEKDNKKILAKIADLRGERARLMGFKTHSHFQLGDTMAQTPERVYELMSKVWSPAIEAAKKERDVLQEAMKKDGVKGKLEGWDWRYYTEKVRKARYDFDEDIMRPYFEVNAVRDGAFMVANKLFGLTFEQRTDLPTWHPDQQVFECKDGDGTSLGILYMDFFIRESKNGGAWMNELRMQSKLDGDVKPIVTNDFNFPRPSATSPSLLNFTEATTLFHEFGHAMHGLISDVVYESQSGTNVPRDYVEFPSQVMENWMSEPEVLKLYAKHYKTGEAIPDALIEKIQKTSKFDQGFATVEYMAAAYLDMDWSTLEEAGEKDANSFEAESMKKLGLIDEIIPRYRSTYFRHIFVNNYSSGYYSYLWSEVLDADAYQAFKETSIFDAETAKRYRTLLSKGGSEPGMDLYRAFRGRDPKIQPLLDRRF